MFFSSISVPIDWKTANVGCTSFPGLREVVLVSSCEIHPPTITNPIKKIVKSAKWLDIMSECSASNNLIASVYLPCLDHNTQVTGVYTIFWGRENTKYLVF
jgi:hypothetical protein